MELRKNISHIQVLVISFFSTLPIQLKLTPQIGGRLLGSTKAPGPIIIMGQLETGNTSQIIFITLFSSRCTAVQRLFFYKPQQTVLICNSKTIFLCETGVFWVFFVEFQCAGSHSQQRWGRASPPTLSVWPCKNIFHIQVLVTNFFPIPPIKLKLGIVSGRLLITNQCFFYWQIFAKSRPEKCDFDQYKEFFMGKMVQNRQISKIKINSNRQISTISSSR
jgi:hypothetical protein